MGPPQRAPELLRTRRRANYYRSGRNRVAARTKIYVTVVRNWGRASEKVMRRSVSLPRTKGMHEVARLDIPPE